MAARRRSSDGLLVFLSALLLLLRVGAGEAEDLFSEQTSHLKRYQIVRPQQVQGRWKRHDHSAHTHRQDTHPDTLTYSIKIDDTLHLLQLTKNKDFLAPHFAVVSHDLHKNTLKSQTGNTTSCHYSGGVVGHDDSLVALSTCNGLRGVIFIGNKSFGLEPALWSSTNEHLLFPLEDSQSEPFVCGLDNKMSHGEEDSHDTVSYMTSFLRRKRNLPQTRYVELVLVVDNQRYNIKNGDAAAVKEEMVRLANLLDTYFQQLNIRIILVGLEIFASGNPFDVSGSAGEVLGRFVSWRKANLTSRIRHDMGQLVVGQSGSYPGGVLGMAFVGTVCSVNNAGGISVYGSNNLGYFSTVLAHEMGHNLGMNHDRELCQCSGSSCIMSPTAGGSTLFSDCSANDFEKLIMRGGGVCLRNQPSQDAIITVPRCGNGILEQGEDCDCGLPENCTSKCCNAATCTFTSGSSCDAGSCCKDCKLLVSGTPCRNTVNECDLPEFCMGTSGFCPPDTYLMDGLPCSGSTAFCYEGRCQTLDYQCQQLFGSSATKADDKCYSHVNTQGTKFGNCGYSGTNPLPCSVANSMCGKVQCTNFDSNYPPPGAVISVENIQGGTISCRNADFNLGSDVLDPAYVKTATVCASGKVCMNFQCVNSSILSQMQKCDALTNCNGKGVCNDKFHCHCNNGWAPPDCRKGGRGGSLDSGPAEIDYSLRNGLLIFFLLVVPILVVLVFGFLYIFRRDTLRRCLKGRRSKRQRSDTPANTQRNGQSSGNVQRAATPSAPIQIPPRNPEPIRPPHQATASYGGWDDEVVPAVCTSVPPRQGPGVPKPIPPKKVST